MSRDDVSFKGLGAKYYTYKTHVSIDADNEGDAVTLTADKTVGLGSSGDVLLGQIFKYDDDSYASVQTQGYAIFDGVSGSLPNEGDCVTVNGSGAVIAMSDVSVGASYQRTNTVIDVNSSTYKVVVLLS